MGYRNDDTVAVDVMVKSNKHSVGGVSELKHDQHRAEFQSNKHSVGGVSEPSFALVASLRQSNKHSVGGVSERYGWVNQAVA